MATMDPKASAMFEHMLVPGAVWLTTGFKGGGKSHTAIAVCEQLVKGMYPSVGKVFLLTNIIFFHKVRGNLKVETPPNVYHVETMKEVFWKIYEIMSEYGHDVKIVLVLDEAQNFIGGDSNQTNASVMMKEFLGTIRKFRLIIWFLTPSQASIGPAFRNWLNDPKYPGNLTAKWRKDLAWNAQFIAKHKLNLSPKEIMVVKNYDSKAIAIQVPVTEWTKTKETLGNGEYCYDHEASATFHVGEDFDWEDFNRVLGGTPSINLLSTIENYYKRIPEMKASEELQNDLYAVLEVAARLRDSTDWPWQKIADTVGIKRNTLTDNLKKEGYWKESWDKKGPKITEKTLKNVKIDVRQENTSPRGDDDGRARGAKLQPKYFSKGTYGNRGYSSPFPVEEPLYADDDNDDVTIRRTVVKSAAEASGDDEL